MRARQTENWSQSNSYNNNNNNGKVVYCLLHGNNIFNRLLNCWSPFGSDCSRHRFLRTVSGKLQGKCKYPYPSPSPSLFSPLFSTQPVHDFHKIYAPRLEHTNVKWWNFYLVQSEIFYIYSTIYICILLLLLFACLHIVFVQNNLRFREVKFGKQNATASYNLFVFSSLFLLLNCESL